ncbi:LysR substrate-binding domain-containing protein [Phytomonospora sp. NPDC050363]|uniref:LysR substrate-binding domain-containing protein n=1 Tax=Phytomonospora sp. NPDC050363 TaxID=3155642 RepID=UPI0033EF18F5
MTGPEVPPTFRLAYVPGVTPTKWVRVWEERLPDVPLTLVATPAAEAEALLREGGADAALLRMPVDRDALQAIPLYTETTVVVVPKDHVVAAVEELRVGELADEAILHPHDDVLEWETPPGRPAVERPESTEDAMAWAAASVGLLIVPQSLARLYHRKDLVYRPLTDAPESRIALSWPAGDTGDLVEEFIGIVRGRTVNSSRGRSAPPPPKAAPTAKKKPPPRKATPAKKPQGGAAKGGGKRGKPRKR